MKRKIISEKEYKNRLGRLWKKWLDIRADMLDAHMVATSLSFDLHDIRSEITLLREKYRRQKKR